MSKLAAALLLILAQAAAAGNKSAGTVTVLGDSPEYSSGSLGAEGGLFRLDGAFAPAGPGEAAGGAAVLEGGFYSRLVQPPLSPDYAGPSTAAYTLAWGGSNPPGTTFEITVSTWAEADPYMAWYTADASGYPVESLGPNTTFYNFLFANYMDGDYSPRVSTAAVTLAVTPSSGVFTLEDAGHDTLAVSFAGFENPHGVAGLPWAPGGALPAARYGQASAASGRYLFLSGGFNGVAFSSAVYRSSVGASGEPGPWEPAGFLPAARYAHQLVAARGRLYLLGGYDASGSRAEVWSADLSSSGVIGLWLAEPALPLPVYFHAAAVGHGRIYVSGGYTSGVGVQSAVFQAVLGDDGAILGWSSPLDLPAPRYSHSLTLLGGRLYAAGGKDGAAARSEVWSAQLSPEGNLPGAWTAYTPLPAPRFGHRTLVSGSRLFVIGGSNGSAAQAQVFMSSAPAAAAGASPWYGYLPLPEGRQFQAGEAVGGRLCVFGGSSGAAARSEVYCSTVTGTEYLVEVSSSPVFDPAWVRSAGWRPGALMRDGGLETGVQYYFRAKARNWTGVETPYSAVGSTVTYAAVPATAAWSNIVPDSMRANWAANGNPAGYTYSVVYSTSPDYLPPAAVQTTALYYDLAGLDPSTTYYAKVRVANPGGRTSRYAELPPARTTFNPALDVTNPGFTDGQADFTDWKGTNTFGCAVQFSDSGGSGLDYFQVQVATDSGGLTGIVAAWATVKTGIGADNYAVAWQLPQNIWEQLPEGASNYVSVRVYDGSGNSALLTDAFSLIKDTTPPQIASSYNPPSVWYNEYPGDVPGLRFDEALSGLARVQYSVSANKSFADAAVVPWTDIPGLTPGATWYEPAALTYSFPQLANATSNYFSFRAVDLAGSTRTLVDAFGIGKNVSGPVVTISTPALAYLSTFTYVSGNALPTNAHPVEGTEVYLVDLSNGLYYSGSAFLSGSRVWHDAEDAASTFTITFANLPLVSGRQYRAVARSSDSVGDYSQVFATYTFTFDALPPAAAVVYPADGSVAESAASISGTAGDASSGITSVEVSLKRLSDGKWWKNSVSAWDPVPEALQAGTTPYWTWNFNPYLRDSLPDGASYYATVRAWDNSSPKNAGAFQVYGATFTYRDTTPPPATATLGAAAGSYSGSVLLSWRTAGDNAAAGYLLDGRYKVAYSTWAGAPVSTTAAQVTFTTATLTAGSTQYAVVSGLDPAATYYFTLWTGDDALNWSPASNEAWAPAGTLDSGLLSGRVTDAAGNPVTGVLVEALSAAGAVEGSDYTDVFGNYSVPALVSAYLSVRAVWSAQDIESSVTKDQVPNGAANVNFTLSVSYQLASISGFIPANFLVKTAARPAGLYTTKAVDTRVSGAFVEVYRKGRRIGAAFAAADGAFSVPNLLPGTYSLRVFNGTDYSEMRTVALRPGENFLFTPKWALLNKDRVFAYPNPAAAEVHLHFEPSAAAYEAEAEVFDVAGRLVKRLTVHAADPAVGGATRRFTWDLARDGAAPGVYIYVLRVRDSSSGETAKAVKKFAIIR